MNRLLTVARLPLIAAAVLALLAAAIALLVLLLLFTPARVAVSLSAAPGGHISPVGTHSFAVGEQVSIEAWSDDENLVPGLVLDGQPVELVRDDDRHGRYTLTVSGEHLLAATFADVADNAVALDVETADVLLEVGEAELVFAASTALLDGLEPGDVLANGIDPHTREVPLLIRVVAVDTAPDGTVTVATEPAALTDFVRRASVAVRLPASFEPADDAQAAAMPLPPRYTATDGSMVSHRFSQDWGGFTLSGNLDIDAPLTDIAFEIGFFSVDAFSATLSETSSAQIGLRGSSRHEISGEVEFFDRTIAVMGIPLGPVVVPVTGNVAAGAGISATARGSISVSADTSLELSAGVAWDGDAGWRALTGATPTFDTSIEVDARAEARAQLVVRPSLRVLGLCGPYFEAHPPYLAFSADIGATPWWVLYGGVDIAGGAACEFTDDWQFASAEVARVRIADAGGPHPTPKATARPSASVSPKASRAASPAATVSPTPGDAGSGPDLAPSGASLEAFAAAAETLGLTCPIVADAVECSDANNSSVGYRAAASAEWPHFSMSAQGAGEREFLLQAVGLLAPIAYEPSSAEALIAHVRANVTSEDNFRESWGTHTTVEIARIRILMDGQIKEGPKIVRVDIEP